MNECTYFTIYKKLEMSFLNYSVKMLMYMCDIVKFIT